MKLKDACPPQKKSYDQPSQHSKKQRHYFVNKCPSSQSYGFSSSHVWMWQLDHKESWALKNWCFCTVVLDKMLESLSDWKDIKPVNLKGNQSWIFIGRTDAEAEISILWLPDVKNWLTRKDPDAGRDWKQEEKGTTEDKMVGWHHQLDGHEFEQGPGVCDGQGSLVSCSPRGHKELDTTQWLNCTKVWPIKELQVSFRAKTCLENLSACFIHCRDWLSEAQRSWVTCPRSHTYEAAGPGLGSPHICFRNLSFTYHESVIFYCIVLLHREHSTQQ